MIEIASQIVIWLLFSWILGIALGVVIGRATKKESESNYAMNPVFTKQGNIYNKPFILGNPRPSGKDDLKAIEGIDEAIEGSLNAMGIFHYDQISKWTQNNCEWVEEHLSLHGKVSEDNWCEQAKQLSQKRL